MKDKVEKILNSREWTFADLTNMSQLVKDFSEEIYTQLDSKEKLSIVWEKDITNIQSFGSFFQTLVTEEIQLQVASILQEQLINAIPKLQVLQPLLVQAYKSTIKDCYDKGLNSHADAAKLLRRVLKKHYKALIWRRTTRRNNGKCIACYKYRMA